ncbi:LPS export ABC transporter permease LptG [Pseudolabrys sp. Root1462]|jgi:lipopolysaccharide export system permease protein|uniref:LPS export ABC transporter permease LptG n=1 Tax=Pseudolabrys sp. Root1462 TaxID=1736466 RepID=UPI000702409A|nr:LPS export ABC transporter permease LptG [Pseudolabrys sp. Root1462]KQZ01276.1 LPS export ABC transporter permease LptG [Pseudolabrys sp. Root1462]
MSVVGGTLARYFGLRFLNTVLMVFFGILLLVALLDYIELMRRASDIPNVSALLVAKTSLFRVPQVAERIMPFCILIGAMSCYLNLSRRLELVVARAAGMSAWQFVAPALIVAFLFGVVATTIYNPVAAVLQERSKRFEAELFGQNTGSAQGGGPFWLSQRTDSGQAIINAKSSRDQGVSLFGVTVFTFDPSGHFRQRIEARSAVLEPGVWHLFNARVYELQTLPVDLADFRFKTSLTPEQVRESFATPETVPFWELPLYIQIADHAGLVAAGYRLQFQKLLARPFFLAAMVFLAAAVSLRFFRFGGIQKMVLSGVAAGFLLYILQKVTEDLSKADLMHPVAAAWLPVLVGGLTGFVALLYQEDG